MTRNRRECGSGDNVRAVIARRGGDVVMRSLRWSKQGRLLGGMSWESTQLYDTMAIHTRQAAALAQATA